MTETGSATRGYRDVEAAVRASRKWRLRRTTGRHRALTGRGMRAVRGARRKAHLKHLRNDGLDADFANSCERGWKQSRFLLSSERVVFRRGGLNVMVNSAAININEARARSTRRRNCWTSLLASDNLSRCVFRKSRRRHAKVAMVDQGGGKIVPVLAPRWWPSAPCNQAVYVATKVAVNLQMTRALASGVGAARHSVNARGADNRLHKCAH